MVSRSDYCFYCTLNDGGIIEFIRTQQLQFFAITYQCKNDYIDKRISQNHSIHAKILNQPYKNKNTNSQKLEPFNSPSFPFQYFYHLPIAMNQYRPHKSQIKKLEESFSDHHSDNHEDTQLQTSEIPNQHKSSKNHTKAIPKETKIQKKEQDISKVSKNQPVKKIHQPKIHKEEEKIQSLRLKKYEDSKYIKNFAQDQGNQHQINSARNSKKNLHKKSKNHEKMEENEKRAVQIIENLDKVYDEDVQLYKQGKTADKKLKYILQVQKTLKQMQLAKSFLNMDGHLVFIDWLLPNPQTRQETSLTVKIHVFNILADIKLTKENIEAGEQLERVMKKYRKSRYEILRNLSVSIVQKWKILKALPNA